MRIFDTQGGGDVVNQDMDVTTFQDIIDHNDFNHNPGMKYSDSATKQDPFANPTNLVTGDMMIFMTPTASKAGK